jgi:ABC-type glycerol-3-phosphate transport system substrate-binding protein
MKETFVSNIVGLLPYHSAKTRIDAIVISMKLLILMILVVFSQAASQTLVVMSWGDDEEWAAYRELVAEYDNLNENVEIFLNHYDSLEDYSKELNDLIERGNPPDVFIVDQNSAYSLFDKKVLLSLEPWTDDMGLSNYSPQDLEIFTFERELYALPRSVTSMESGSGWSIARQSKIASDAWGFIRFVAHMDRPE